MVDANDAARDLLRPPAAAAASAGAAARLQPGASLAPLLLEGCERDVRAAAAHLRAARLPDDALRRYVVALRFAPAAGSAGPCLPAEIVLCGRGGGGGGGGGEMFLLSVLPLMPVSDPRVQVRRERKRKRKKERGRESGRERPGEEETGRE